MDNDRLLTVLRWFVTPIALALIAGYFQVRTNANTNQTRATYDTLAPNVLELQTQVATLTGRIEELARRPIFVPPCPEALKTAGKPSPRAALGTLGGKTELMVDRPDPPSPEPPPPSQQKIPARFEDMVQQQKKY